MKVLKNENGYALVTVTVFVMAITIVTGSLFGYYSAHVRVAKNDIFKTQAFYLAEAGIYKTLWHLAGNGGHDWRWRPVNENVQAFDDKAATITVEERGGFLKIISTATVSKKSHVLKVLVGQKMPQLFNHAIILGGNDLPLVVTGKNKIIGDVMVGKSGIKTGSIKGTRFSGGRIVDGDIKKISPPVMPVFDSNLLQSQIALFEDYLKVSTESDSVVFGAGPNQSIVFTEGLIDETTLTDSLLARELTIISPKGLLIKGSFSFPNPVTIICGDSVVVSGTVAFNDAIIYARNKISLTGNTSGAIQAISGGDIILEDNVELKFPSLIYCSGRQAENKITGEIRLLDQAKLVGTAVLDKPTLPEGSNSKNNMKAFIGSDAKLVGLLYSTNRAEIRGKVSGCVITNEFYLYESPTTYINWLKDATFNRTALRGDFYLPLLFKDETNFEILAWL